MSGPMVRAILAGAKTQTRRIVKPQPVGVEGGLRFPWATFFDNGHVHTWDRSGVGGQNWDASEYPGENKYAAALTRTPYENPCPYGVPGDRLWVRESYWLSGFYQEAEQADADEVECPKVYCHYEAGGDGRVVTLTAAEGKRLRSRKLHRGRVLGGRYMYRSCSRLTLEVVSVRAELDTLTGVWEWIGEFRRLPGGAA